MSLTVGNNADKRRKDDKASYLYFTLYQKQGLSLQQIADTIGETRQAVFGLFYKRNYKLRSVKRKPCKFFFGIKFTETKDGYFRRTDGNRELMHRFVYKFYYGRIPDNYDIHHRNHDKTDNRIENLQLVRKDIHARHHSYKKHKEKYCLQCDIRMLRHQGEGYTAYQKRVFCSRKCSKQWAKGKPRGTRVSTFNYETTI